MARSLDLSTIGLKRFFRALAWVLLNALLSGFLQSEIGIQCLANLSEPSRVVTLKWYNGKYGYVAGQSETPALVVCYDSGRIQIMKNESDECEFGKNCDQAFLVRFLRAQKSPKLLTFSKANKKSSFHI